MAEDIAGKSPVVVRTRFHGQYVCIQDLESQLYRDSSRVYSENTKEYIQELIDRLQRLRSKG